MPCLQSSLGFEARLDLKPLGPQVTFNFSCSCTHHQDPQRDGAAASIPQLSCPGLISRSQSALSEDNDRPSSLGDRPTLLTASKVGKIIHIHKHFKRVMPFFRITFPMSGERLKLSLILLEYNMFIRSSRSPATFRRFLLAVRVESFQQVLGTMESRDLMDHFLHSQLRQLLKRCAEVVKPVGG